MSESLMNNSNSTFASRLTLARKEKGLTQKILAKKIGIHVTNIIKYEVKVIMS